MKSEDLGLSPLTSSGKLESPLSSRLKMSMYGRQRKTTGKNVASPLLMQRQSIRIIDENSDVTPKILSHPKYSAIDERNITALEMIGLIRVGSTGHLSSSSTIDNLKKSSSMLVRTSSLPASSMIMEAMQFESFWSTQLTDSRSIDTVDKAPSQFYLPSIDPNIFPCRPETVTITLRETETFFIFEMLPYTGDLRTPEGLAIRNENEMYEYKTTGPGSNRKLVNSETQTLQVLTKSRGTYLRCNTRKNQAAFVNNWVMHDVYAAPDLMTERNNLLIVRTKESMERLWEEEELRDKLPPLERHKKTKAPEEQLEEIFQNVNFANAVRVMERIISNNIFINAQKRFIGLIKQDPCSLDLEFTYSLDLLWKHKFEMSEGRPVTSFRWSYVMSNILAVGYGARAHSEIKDGVLLIWSAKNPHLPGRWYEFESPISDLDWSRDRPNLLAIGFNDGQIKVLDVSTIHKNVIRQSERITSPSCSPQWQVQWWPGDEHFDYQEQIYTCDQDGHIFCYQYAENFLSTTIMKIYRIEGTLPGVARTSHCVGHDTLINRSPGALVLRRHPTLSAVYFVGSDEGCIYKCSTNYLYQHIESFLAHDGPVYSIMFSSFCPKIFLTCGADWCTRIWAEGLAEPLITLSTAMACVRYAAWCPTHSTIIVSIVNNEICIWDIRRKIHTPASVTVSPKSARLVMVDFTADGNRLVTADMNGNVFVYNLEGMPFPPYNQEQVLIESIEKALVTKPLLLRKLRKLGPPFQTEEGI
ncbi:dynein axonemal intermediate chain 4 [Megalopta genalis]|uniref:dynein axonemal intermediate chain 4 n=1 Tax=Megalopta genalis TaxID=115081 RepID=UPI00144302A9|nr:WD repeat-containing protein 78-like [Megalopta genalis]XP_033322088.1 WD repeat-containing protein 78-like [Megalopta genalis]